MKKIILVLIVLGVIALSGCGSLRSSPTGNVVVCNPPYMQLGLDCCLDKNNNRICDTDEPPEEDPIKECIFINNGKRMTLGIRCELGQDCLEPAKKFELSPDSVACEKTELRKFKWDNQYLYCDNNNDCKDQICELDGCDEESNEFMNYFILECEDHYCKTTQGYVDIINGGTIREWGE